MFITLNARFRDSIHATYFCNRNLNLSEEENDACNASPSFPLSDMLRSARFELGRNARMMAAQPTDRMASNAKVGSQETCSGPGISVCKT